MPLFPPTAAVAVTVDGKPLAAYVRAYVVGNRVYAPASPLLSQLADRMWLHGDLLTIIRGTKLVRVRIAAGDSAQLDTAFVAVGPVLRAFGADVRYEAARRRLDVSFVRRASVASPTPFDPAAPSAAPSAVFTPLAAPTPRPVWTGSPLPRRTPLPLPPPLRPE